MSKPRISLPISTWPEDIAQRFKKAFRDSSPAQRQRLETGLGRWLLAAERDDLPPEFITPALVAGRTKTMQPTQISAMKQALFAVFDEVSLFVPELPVEAKDDRSELASSIARNLSRLPPDWRERAEPALYISPDGLDDGAIIEARSLAAIKRMLETAYPYFDFCRDAGLAVDLTPKSFAAWVDQRQQQFHEQRFSIYTMVIEAQSLLALARDLFPERDWNWLMRFAEKMKTKARIYPTRNNARVVQLEELRIAASQASALAHRLHLKATGYKARLRAHTLARTALTILVLVNSPIRLSCLAKLDLQRHFDPTYSRFHLSADETKDRKADDREVGPELRKALLSYIETHRPLVAPRGETRLFVGREGKPCDSGYLCQRMGDLTEALFEKRVTPHVVRNVIAGFIVSESPRDAALAGEILRHGDEPTTETYRSTAKQIEASRLLSNAAEARAKAAEASCARRKPGAPRTRSAVLSRRRNSPARAR